MNRSRLAGTTPRGPLKKVCQTPFSSIFHRRIRKVDSLRNVRQRRRRNISAVTLQDFIKKTWLTYSCSPLHHFKNDKASLKLYSRLLSAVFNAHAQKNMGFSTQEEEIATKAIFSLAKGIAITTDEPEAVKLSITTKDGKVISEIYFCSVEADPVVDTICDLAEVPGSGIKGTVSEQFTVFPVILCKGNVTPRNIAFDWMKTEFDCVMSKTEFNTISMSWMLGLWGTLCPNKDKRKATRFVWRIPVPGLGLDTIESEFDPESIEMLWKEAHDASSDVVELNDINKFFGGIQEHLTNHFKIKFQKFPLQQLDLEIVNLHKDGKIKILCEEHVHTVLSHLTSIATEKLDWKKHEE